MDLLKRLHSSRLVTYIAVGGTAYLLEMACLYALKTIAGLSSVRSVAISFWLGFLVAFFMQKLVTFKNRQFSPRHIVTQGVGYSALVTWNYCFSLLMVGVLQKHISVFMIRTLAIMCITLWNYKLYHILFRHEKNQNQQK